MSSYENHLSTMRNDNDTNITRTKEFYEGVIDRMKEEHTNALQRISDLKNFEVQAAVSASTRTK